MHAGAGGRKVDRQRGRGLTQLASPARNAGLAAIMAPERTRESVLEALRARRVYATNGARIFLRVTLDGQFEMGSVLPPRGPDAPETHQLDIRVAAPAPLARIDLIVGERVVASLDGEGRTEWSSRLEIPALTPGEFLYVRVVQTNEGAAWSSPFFAE